MIATVCVTGAAGFVGSHVCAELLARGHHVRAVVRDPGSEEKTAHLRRLAGSERLTLVGADVTVPGSLHVALRGAAWACHAAAAVVLRAKDPQREIVDVAVKGTESFLDAVTASGSVTRVALVSSVAAVLATTPRPGHTYTEEDWNADATLDANPYGLGKMRSERAAWDHRESLAGSDRFALTVVNPVLVTGPLLAKAHVRSSPSAIRSLARGDFHGCPPLSFGIVDVRDVAAAVGNGLEGGVTGRFILNARSMWMHEVATTIAAGFPALRVPTRRIPGWLLYAAALFDKRVSFAYLRRNLGRMDRISGDRAPRELGFAYRDAQGSIVDTVRSLQDLGLLGGPATTPATTRTPPASSS